jgi:hypothetical protein
VPTPLADLIARFLQVNVGVAVMPPPWPWDFESKFVNLTGCAELGLWIEKAMATVEMAMAEGHAPRIVLWLPAQVDQDWFRRLAKYPVCFVSETFLREQCGTRKRPTALVLLLPWGDISEEFDRFSEDFEEVGYVWS